MNAIVEFFQMLIGLAGIFLFLYIIFWIFRKFFGVNIVSKSGIGEAIHQESMNAFYLNKMDQDLVQEAITRCSKKGFAKTHSNVLDEIEKIQKERERENIITRTPVSRLTDYLHKLKSDKFDRLSKLFELKKKGVLTDEEFEIEKRKILDEN